MPGGEELKTALATRFNDRVIHNYSHSPEEIRVLRTADPNAVMRRRQAVTGGRISRIPSARWRHLHPEWDESRAHVAGRRDSLGVRNDRKTGGSGTWDVGAVRRLRAEPCQETTRTQSSNLNLAFSTSGGNGCARAAQSTLLELLVSAAPLLRCWNRAFKVCRNVVNALWAPIRSFDCRAVINDRRLLLAWLFGSETAVDSGASEVV